MIDNGTQVIKCNMIHNNGCDHMIKGKHIKDLEKQMLEHERTSHPLEFYSMNHQDRSDIHEFIEILFMSSKIF